MAINKVVFGSDTLIDLTSDTAVQSDVAQGKYFHLATGERVQGTASGGGGSTTVYVDSASASSYTSSTLTFTGLQGDPTSFAVVSTSNRATGDSDLTGLVYDGSAFHGQHATTQAEAVSAGFSKSYSNGTLVITSTNANIPDADYDLVYSYGGGSNSIVTEDVQVGSGATSITFTGLADEPKYWSCIFKSNFSTSSGYQRVIVVVHDGTDTYGMEMDSSAKYSAVHWSYSYSSGSLTISSQGTNAGGYFHQPGYYQLTAAIEVDETLQQKTVTPTTSQQIVTADAPYEALSRVTVNPIPSEYIVPTGNIAITSNTTGGNTLDVSQYATATVNVPTGGGGSVNVATTTWSNNSTSTVSHQFTGLLGTPKAAFLRCTSQLTRSSSNTYYYIADIVWDGTDAWGNYHLRSNGSFNNVAKDAASGFNVTVGTNSITFSSDASSRSSAPGSFYNGTYELTYVY